MLTLTKFKHLRGSVLKRIVLTLFFVITLTNCSGYQAKKSEFHEQFNLGYYTAAARVMLPSFNQDASKDDFADEKFLFSLNAGTAFLFSHEYDLSTRFLDISEAFMLNGETSGYDIKYYDKIMLSTYKALAYLHAGDLDNAKLEFNRAYSYQAEAVEENKKAISKSQEKIREQGAKKSLASANSIINKQYNDFDNFKAYKDFTNPYTTYISGLFFLNADGISKSDRENGLNYLKRVQGMAPHNKFIKMDIASGEKSVRGQNPPPTVWVIYENGLVADVAKSTYTIPFYIPSGVKIAQINLPKLVPLSAAYSELLISDGKNYTSTEPLADMDRVIKTEFQQRFPMEVTKAIIWMTANLLAQEAAQQAIGTKKDHEQLLGALAAMAISQASNPVDTRTWTSLPKSVHIARINMPQNRTVKIYTNSHHQLSNDIVFDKDVKYALIHVRVPMVGAIPSIGITKFR